MRINAIIKSSSLSADETINITGGVNSQSEAIQSSCTDCNCWVGNQNTKDPTTPIKRNNLINE